MSLRRLGRPVAEPLFLPSYEGSVPAGFPTPAEDYMESPLDLNEYLIGNKAAATFLMRVDGDSMRDAGILHGDLLVVDRAAPPVHGSIVVVAINGEYTCKRLRCISDGIWLDPANPRYKPLRVPPDAELHVFGVVKHAIHTLR